MQKNCLICERIIQIKKKTNSNFVAELETGYVVLGDYQYYKGYYIFLCKQHVKELHELDKDYKKKFLEEMCIVAESIYKTFKPIKLNYELLGNKDPHLHWHIFPRYANDPKINFPIWCLDKSVRYSDSAKQTETELEKWKTILKKELINLKKGDR